MLLVILKFCCKHFHKMLCMEAYHLRDRNSFWQSIHNDERIYRYLLLTVCSGIEDINHIL